MNLHEHFINAKTDLSRNKLRTWLSMLGIIIWVFSVVVMLAIGNGTKQDIVSQIESLGTNLLSVTPWWSNRNMRRAASTTESATLDEWMVSYIQANVSNIGAVAPTISNRSVVTYGDYTTNATVNGVTPDYLIVKNLTVAEGSFITADDVETLNKSAVLGHDIAETMFWSWVAAVDPIGEKIKMGNLVMTVVGVLEDNSMSNDALFVPITTAETRLFGTHDYASILLSAKDTTIAETTKTELENSLRKYLWLSETATATFTVQSQSDMIETMSSITWVMTWFLAWIAAISLLVWGIGVMNIMLVSVTERTKEIGIRKAIGAHKKDIILQFLTESVVLSLMGWIIWIIMSFIIVFVINIFLTAIISIGAVLLAFFSAVAIGIVFWILPANNAAKLKPIEALRYE